VIIGRFDKSKRFRTSAMVAPCPYEPPGPPNAQPVCQPPQSARQVLPEQSPRPSPQAFRRRPEVARKPHLFGGASAVQPDPSTDFSMFRRDAPRIDRPQSLASFSRRNSGRHGSSHNQNLCYAFHDWLRSLLFLLRANCAVLARTSQRGSGLASFLTFLLWCQSSRSDEEQPRRVTIGFDPHFFPCGANRAAVARGAAKAGLGCSVRRDDPHTQYTEAYWDIWRTRHGGEIAHNCRTRYSR
jgi:hypothetical protein